MLKTSRLSVSKPSEALMFCSRKRRLKRLMDTKDGYTKLPKTAPKRQTPALWLMIAGGVLLLGVVVFAIVSAQAGDKNASTGTAPDGGTPKLVVDQEQIDFGDVPMDKPVTATFKIRNEGTGTLVFSAAPYIEVKEGC